MTAFPTTIEKPGAAVRQVSGKNLAGACTLAVLVKARYQLRNGACAAPQAVGLLDEPAFSDDGLVLEEEADVFPDKFASDVVIRGTVFGGGRNVVDATLDLAGRHLEWRVFGDRTVLTGGPDGLRFSVPEVFEKVELSFRNAYGGRDFNAEERARPPWREGLDPYAVPAEDLPDHVSPFSYPRNPAGKGYVLGPDPLAAVGISLPNIEFAANLLTPAKLLCPDLLSWPLMPLPAAAGWVSYEWFPRSGYCNFVRPYHDRIRSFAEVELGQASPDVVDPQMDSPEAGHRFACGAPGHLQFPYLRGGEPVSCRELGGHGKHLAFNLPAPPRIWTDGRNGTLKPAEVVVHSLVLDADKDELTIVWRGSAPALRSYLPDELPTMPLKVMFDPG